MRRELTKDEEEMWVGAALRVAGHVSNAITIGQAINSARKGRRREEVEDEQDLIWGAVARAGVKAGMRAMRRELTEDEEEMWVGAALRVAGHVSNAITIGQAINKARKG